MEHTYNLSVWEVRQENSILKVQVQQRLTSVWRGVSVAEALMISF